MGWFSGTKKGTTMSGGPVQNNNSPGPDEGPICFLPSNGTIGPDLSLFHPDFIDTRIQKKLPGDVMYQGQQLYQAQMNSTYFDPQYPAAQYTGWADRNSYQTKYNQGQRIQLDSVVHQGATPSGVTILAQWADVQTIDSGGFNQWVANGMGT